MKKWRVAGLDEVVGNNTENLSSARLMWQAVIISALDAEHLNDMH
jgi:hypothetical protein